MYMWQEVSRDRKSEVLTDEEHKVPEKVRRKGVRSRGEEAPLF